MVSRFIYVQVCGVDPYIGAVLNRQLLRCILIREVLTLCSCGVDDFRSIDCLGCLAGEMDHNGLIVLQQRAICFPAIITGFFNSYVLYTVWRFYFSVNDIQSLRDGDILDNGVDRPGVGLLLCYLHGIVYDIADFPFIFGYYLVNHKIRNDAALYPYCITFYSLCFLSFQRVPDGCLVRNIKYIIIFFQVVFHRCSLRTVYGKVQGEFSGKVITRKRGFFGSNGNLLAAQLFSLDSNIKPIANVLVVLVLDDNILLVINCQRVLQGILEYIRLIVVFGYRMLDLVIKRVICADQVRILFRCCRTSGRPYTANRLIDVCGWLFRGWSWSWGWWCSRIIQSHVKFHFCLCMGLII